jgi:hypothetical protein
VTFVQRTSSDLRLNPHLHVVFLDGAYHEAGAEAPKVKEARIEPRAGPTGSGKPRVTS